MADPSPFAHRPVLVDEVVEVFADVGNGVVVDATLGGGGHAAALAASQPGRTIIGIDRDPAALEAAAARFAADPELSGRLSTWRGRFDEVLADLGVDEPVLGVLLDLGVSSPQLDRTERGFSYRVDAPLDMRMDPDAPRSAADILADTDEADLARILWNFGDERFARRIARGIVAARPVTTTGQLVDIVRAAIPAPARRRGGHPAKRTFQALRIAVNDELDALETGLEAALAATSPGGRVAAISYHSGEDRIVKRAFRNAVSGGCVCPPGLPCVCGAEPSARNRTRGGITPTPSEIEANPRAASARLRAVEVIA
ncbi:MAG TPA: 16S rRNA (cytosine(1402)-N(4))-methyltransferase RsmH [Acidimicrobiales bacterium]|nr:16S rRNA (cytosine(1402)-N(4))-methyltransferase RsmH [Acidimicrobiales bacterium]